MKMNGGPLPEPVRLKDLGYNDVREYALLSAYIEDNPVSFNDDLVEGSWLYQKSELHGEDGFHIFKRGEETAAVPASEEWVQQNRRED